MTPRKFSVSMMREFLTCEERFNYRYNRRLAPKKFQRALAFGSMGHRLLEKFYRFGDSFDLETEIEEIRVEEEKKIHDAQSWNTLETDLAILEGMISAYIPFWKEADDKWNVLEVEKHITDTRPINGLLFHGIPDLVVHTGGADGNIWVLDHKFLSIIEAGLIRRLPLDLQVGGYVHLYNSHLLANGSSDRVRGVCYNILKKSRKRLKKNQSPRELTEEIRNDYLEKPQDMFFREYVIVGQEAKSSFARGVDEFTRDLNHKLHNGGPWKRNVYECDKYGECAFIELCLQGDKALHLFKEREY